ncbi:MAG TPA: FHA domain-containing protein [Nostocaceae cyanobacterium]|nr:FHA domain-containing protein [Nostocaceae cyanobacterium]
MMTELVEQKLKRRLNLYQIFLKLYEHHSGLLDEILQLENLDQLALLRWQSNYVHGLIEKDSVYLLTNLCNAQTQKLQQSQHIWLMGRDQNCGIAMTDKFLSRRHAAIQYREKEGFYLIDLKSTNGSYVNGEPVTKPVKLQDGDRIRLGNTSFNFFFNHTSQTLPALSPDTLTPYFTRTDSATPKTKINYHYLPQPQREKASLSVGSATTSEMWGNLEDSYYSLSLEQQSEILDRFFSRQTRDGIENAKLKIQNGE